MANLRTMWADYKLGVQILGFLVGNLIIKQIIYFLK